MKKYIFSFIAFTFFIFSFSFFTRAQSWVDMMNDNTVNVHDVQKAFYQWYATQQNNNQKGEDDEAAGYSLFKRWEWYMAARTYPTGKRPDYNAIANDYQNYLSHRATQRAMATASWQYVGNTVPVVNGGSGRVNRIRFMPGNPNTLFACCPTGGLWKSTNGGTTWATTTDQLIDLAVSDVAIDPANTNIMYVSTGDGDGIGGGYTTLSTVGVLKSTDGGLTWNPTGLYLQQYNTGPTQSTVNQLLLNPNNTSLILAATSFGLYYTSNAGVYWRQIMTGNFKSLEFEPGHPSVVYAATGNSLFYRSTDAGSTWSNITNGLPANATRLQIAVTPADSNYVYVLACQNLLSGYQGLYLSTDRGQTFSTQSTSPNLLGWSPTGNDFGGQGWYTLALAVSPTNKDSVVVGGVDIWKSSDKGVTWKLNAQWTGTGAPYVHADIHCLTFNPAGGSYYFAATDGGVWKNINADTSWRDYSHNLEISEQYAVGPSSNTTGMWLTGWQDNGINISGSPWNQVLGGDGMVPFIDFSNDNTMYAENYQGDFQLSTDGGNTWNAISNGIGGNAPWVTRWMQDPQVANTIFGGYSDLWKSTNQGTSWSQLSNFSTTSNSVSAIAIDQNNDNYISVAQPGQILYTDNGGTSWRDITAGLPVASAGISGIAFNSNKPQHIWVTFSGYNATAKVFYSADSGATWTNISNGLPNLPVNCIVYQNGSPEGVYIGTECGAYYMDSNTRSWASYGTGLPNVIINDLKITKTDNKLLAATYGRGSWETDLYSAPAAKPVAHFKAFPVKICAGDTVTFTDTSANQPTMWNWTFNGGSPASSAVQNPVVVYSTAGTYPVKLVASNLNGSDSLTQNSYISVYALPVVPTLSQSWDTVFCTPTNMASYQWYVNGNPVNGATTYTCTVVQNGSYMCAITDSNGCTNTNSISITNAGVNEISLNDFVGVYPNPTDGNVQVVFNLPSAGNYNIAVTNVLGQQVYSQAVHLEPMSVQTINMAGYGKGVYFLTIKGSNARAQKKIIVY